MSLHYLICSLYETFWDFKSEWEVHQVHSFILYLEMLWKLENINTLQTIELFDLGSAVQMEYNIILNKSTSHSSTFTSQRIKMGGKSRILTNIHNS